MKILNGMTIIVVALIAFWFLLGVSDYSAQQQIAQSSEEPAVTEMSVLTSIRPQPRPSDVIQIGNHWVFSHELLNCDRNPICDLTSDAEAGDQVFLDLSPTELEQQRAAISAALLEAIAQP